MTEEEIDVASYGRMLADLLIDALPKWTETVVVDRAGKEHAAAGLRIGQTIAVQLSGELRALLTTDIDSQRQSPLALIRQHVGPATEYLSTAGIPHRMRDAYDEDVFPSDVYAIVPKAWIDFGEEVSDAGLRWGAAKAMAHRKRHQAS